MPLPPNQTAEFSSVYITAFVSIVVAVITVIGSIIITRKSRKNAIELERLKLQFELAKEYERKKIDYVGRLLNFVYNIRVAATKLNGAFDLEQLNEVIEKTTAFEDFYRSNAENTNLFDELIRSYAHETFRIHAMLRQYRARFSTDCSVKIRNIGRELYTHSLTYEGFLRELSKEQFPSL